MKPGLKPCLKFMPVMLCRRGAVVLLTHLSVPLFTNLLILLRILLCDFNNNRILVAHCEITSIDYHQDHQNRYGFQCEVPIATQLAQLVQAGFLSTVATPRFHVYIPSFRWSLIGCFLFPVGDTQRSPIISNSSNMSCLMDLICP